jgi:mycofactocin glycosyltransferase
MRYRLDRGARRLDGGRILLAGSPLTLFRLTLAGRGVVDAIDRGDEVQPSTLTDRLLDTGAAHPVPAGREFTPHDVTAVVPVHAHDPAATVAALGDVRSVVVVDDATEPPLTPIHGTSRVRHPVRQGPGAARMSGLDVVETPLVAFVDADCVPEADWLEPLLAHFDDDRVGLAAPRVATGGPGWSGPIVRYEALRSPLDLGPTEGRIAPTTRVAFVPAAALLVRVDALRTVGGFDPSLPVGEDVDLVWRMVERGWRCRYEPRSVVRHRPRPTLREVARQRVAYGRSATPLHQRHPGAVAPAIIGPWAAGGWVLLALGHPLAGLAMGAAPIIGLVKTLPAIPERTRVAVRLSALAFVRAGQQLASVLTRVLWPVTLLAAVFVRRTRVPIVAVATVPALLDWARRPGGLDPVRYLALRLTDDVAYGAGVWMGAWSSRDLGALLPRLGRRARARAARAEATRSEVVPVT